MATINLQGWNCRCSRTKQISVAEPTMGALKQTSTRQLTDAMILVSEVVEDGQVVEVRHCVEKGIFYFSPTEQRSGSEVDQSKYNIL
jgi:hypothetical protein